MGGHLFIVHGDVLGVACDAILIPSGTGQEGDRQRAGEVMSAWISELGDCVRGRFLIDAPDAARRVVKVREGDGIRLPAIWAGFTGDRGNEPLAFYTEVVSAFIAQAGRHARLGSHEGVRPLVSDTPLVALPLVGSGEGGKRDDAGELLRGVVQSIATAAAEEDVDVALVLRDPTAYAAAQQARSLISRPGSWSEITEIQEREAQRIARLAREGRLVAFLGAGASMGAGLPSWSQLLENLAHRADLRDSERDELRHLEARDAGRILDQRLKPRGGLAKAVEEETAAARGSLVHLLVASLPISEVVTTNYDTLFESAWRNTGRQPRILPWDPLADARPWLLKLHGSTDHPDSIVLSRDDYLRFEGEGVALAGIVQAMLLTRHMLFVGYSLSDDNFHRLVHQVRTAIGSTKGQKPTLFGTALTPRALSLSDGLWGENIQFVTTADVDRIENPRRTAILLDRIGALAAAPAAHVLYEKYSALFTPPQALLRDRLLQVWAVLDEGGLDEATKQAVRDALERIAPREPA